MIFEWLWSGPLKRLPTYLSHRGSGLDVVRKKKFWKNLFLKWVSFFFFFFFESNLLRMRFFEILSLSNEQKVILLTTSLTNHNAQLLTWSHWLERIWNHWKHVIKFASSLWKFFRLNLQRQSRKWNA